MWARTIHLTSLSYSLHQQYLLHGDARVLIEECNLKVIVLQTLNAEYAWKEPLYFIKHFPFLLFIPQDPAKLEYFLGTTVPSFLFQRPSQFIKNSWFRCSEDSKYRPTHSCFYSWASHTCGRSRQSLAMYVDHLILIAQVDFPQGSILCFENKFLPISRYTIKWEELNMCSYRERENLASHPFEDGYSVCSFVRYGNCITKTF